MRGDEEMKGFHFRFLAVCLVLLGTFGLIVKAVQNAPDVPEPTEFEINQSESLERAQAEMRARPEYQREVLRERAEDEARRAETEDQPVGGSHKELLSPDKKWILSYGYDSFVSAGSGRNVDNPDMFEPSLTLDQKGSDGKLAQDLVSSVSNALDKTGYFRGSLAFEAVHAVAFSPNSKLLAIGAGDMQGFATETSALPGAGAICIWDIDQEQIVRTIRVEDMSPAELLAFSPDGTKLVAGMGDFMGTVMLFHVQTGKQLWSSRPDDRDQPMAEVQALVFTPDGRDVVAGGYLRQSKESRGPRTWLRRIEVATGRSQVLNGRFSVPTVQNQLSAGIDKLDLSTDGREAIITQEGGNGKMKTIRVRIR